MPSALTPRRVLLAIAAALFVAGLLPQRYTDAIARRPSHALLAVIQPFTHVLTRFSNAVRRPADLTLELGDKAKLESRVLELEGFNLRLLHDLEETRNTLARMSELRQVLRPLVGTALPADVVASSGGGKQAALTINAGERAGVKAGMVVTSGYCLVGRVVDAGPVSAVVRLITAPATGPLEVHIAPPAEGAGTGARAPRRLVAGAKPSGRHDELWVEAGVNAPVQVGDLARLYDDSWPSEARGFAVGKVVRIERLGADPLLRRRIVIQPIRTLPSLNHVEVILPASVTP